MSFISPATLLVPVGYGCQRPRGSPPVRASIMTSFIPPGLLASYPLGSRGSDRWLDSRCCNLTGRSRMPTVDCHLLLFEPYVLMSRQPVEYLTVCKQHSSTQRQVWHCSIPACRRRHQRGAQTSFWITPIPIPLRVIFSRLMNLYGVSRIRALVTSDQCDPRMRRVANHSWQIL